MIYARCITAAAKSISVPSFLQRSRNCSLRFVCVRRLSLDCSSTSTSTSTVCHFYGSTVIHEDNIQWFSWWLFRFPIIFTTLPFLTTRAGKLTADHNERTKIVYNNSSFFLLSSSVRRRWIEVGNLLFVVAWVVLEYILETEKIIAILRQKILSSAREINIVPCMPIFAYLSWAA